jgi:SNF2 family DNA or RNA helicase
MRETRGEGITDAVAGVIRYDMVNPGVLAEALDVELKPYQIVGVNWLYLLYQVRRPCRPEGSVDALW